MSTLADLTEGQAATIVEVSGDDQISQRIMEMGLTDGEQVSLRRIAPMGDPMEFSVRGYRVSLRRAEAARVSVEIHPSKG